MSESSNWRQLGVGGRHEEVFFSSFYLRRMRLNKKNKRVFWKNGRNFDTRKL